MTCPLRQTCITSEPARESIAMPMVWPPESLWLNLSLQILHVVAHSGAVQCPMKQEQGLNKLANAVLLLGTPGDAGVRDASLVQSKEIRIEARHYALLGGCKSELLGIADTATSRVLRCQDV